MYEVEESSLWSLVDRWRDRGQHEMAEELADVLYSHQAEPRPIRFKLT